MPAELACPACAHDVGDLQHILGATPTCPICGKQRTLVEPILLTSRDLADPPTDDSSTTAASSVSVTPPQPGLIEAFLWCVGLVVLLQFLPGFVGGYLGVKSAHAVHRHMTPQQLMQTPEFKRTIMISVGVSGIASLLVICLVIPGVLGPTWSLRIGIRWPSGFHLLLALLGLPAIMLVATGVDGLARLVLPELIDIDESFRMMAGWPLFYGILIMSLLPGIGEELWFRAYFGQGLIGRFGVIGGVLITSLLFGVVHLEPRHAVGAFAIGVILHLTYLASRSLFIPILLHVLNNFLSLLVLRNPQLGIDAIAADQVPWTNYTAAVCLTAAVGWAFYRTRIPESDGTANDKIELTGDRAIHPPIIEENWELTAVHVNVPNESPDTRFDARDPGIQEWLLLAAAGTLFVAVIVPTFVESHSYVAPFYPEMPNAREVEEMLRAEPISFDKWTTWSKRLREWLPDRSGNSDVAFEAAELFLNHAFGRIERVGGEYVGRDPFPPVCDDPMAWYIRGRGKLKTMIAPNDGTKRGQDAEPLLRRSIALDSTNGRAHYALAVALFLQTNPKLKDHPRYMEAVREAEEGERLDPTTSAKAAQAWAAMIHRRYADAERLYCEIVRERPYDTAMRDALKEVRTLIRTRSGWR